MQAYHADSTSYNKERRQFLMNSINLGILGFSAVITGYGVYEARRKALLEKVTVLIKGLPKSFEGFSIAQFTDLHVGPTIKREFVESVVEQVNNLNADVIVFTGDMIDGTVDYLKNNVEPLKELSAPYGSFFILRSFDDGFEFRIIP